MFAIQSDYIGKFAISQNKFDNAELNLYIDDVERTVLIDLFGLAMYNDFVADLDSNNVPMSANYLFIFNEFEVKIDCIYSEKMYSFGIKEMLKRFVYFHYLRDQNKTNSSIGNVKSKGVASNIIKLVDGALIREYNYGVGYYNAIQQYINDNLIDYPLFNGVAKEMIV